MILYNHDSWLIIYVLGPWQQVWEVLDTAFVSDFHAPLAGMLLTGLILWALTALEPTGAGYSFGIIGQLINFCYSSNSGTRPCGICGPTKRSVLPEFFSLAQSDSRLSFKVPQMREVTR